MRRWDEYDAYLFDLDGTILTCKDAVHYFGFCHALQLMSGRALNLDGVTAHGNTDTGIVRDALTLAGLSAATWRPLLSQGIAAMEAYVREHENEMSVQAIAGAGHALDHLTIKGAYLSVATGNLASIGSIKLRRSGLQHYFSTVGFSDGLESRTQVFERAIAALRRARSSVDSICVVGDTPLDVQAAHDNGVSAIAVATGVFSMEALRTTMPEYCVPSLLALSYS